MIGQTFNAIFKLFRDSIACYLIALGLFRPRFAIVTVKCKYWVWLNSDKNVPSLCCMQNRQSQPYEKVRN